MFSKKSNEKPETDKERAERIAKVTMTGDLRDCILDFLKHDKNPLPWNLQGEDDQANTIEKVENAVRYTVRALRAINCRRKPRRYHGQA